MRFRDWSAVQGVGDCKWYTAPGLVCSCRDGCCDGGRGVFLESAGEREGCCGTDLVLRIAGQSNQCSLDDGFVCVMAES